MPDLLKPSQELASPELATEYARWFVNRRAYTRQSEAAHPASGRHYYYRPKNGGAEVHLTLRDIERHLEGHVTLGLYAINPRTQRVKWMAIDADYRRALEDLLRLQYELGQSGIQAALEQSRRGGHLWIFFEFPVPANQARIFVRHIAGKLSVELKGAGKTDGLELFPRQDRVDAGQFGSAIRGPLGLHRASGKRYWFYGAAYSLPAQMEYLRSLRRVTERQLAELIADIPAIEVATPASVSHTPASQMGFQILEYVEVHRKVGRNWVTQCPSCAAAGHDRSHDNLAISIAEPWKYLCWAGCTKEQIRAALGAPLPKQPGDQR
jgi:hypothetical protein